MTKRIGYLVVFSIMVLALAACGGGAPEATATPLPTETPVPTEAPPTRTPEPTVDVSALSADNLMATAQAIETELTIQERNLGSASGSEGASVQATIDRLKRQLAEVMALVEAAQGEAEATEEATAEAGS